MKLVKKLLRLFPLFFYICIFITYPLSHTLTIGTGSTVVQYFTQECTSIVESNFVSWFSYTIFNSFYSWLRTNFFGGRNFQLFAITYSILVYELILSIVFLMFDVFNFILGMANKWLKKGGNLDE